MAIRNGVMIAIPRLGYAKLLVLPIYVLWLSTSWAQQRDLSTAKKFDLDKVYGGFLTKLPFELQQTSYQPSFSIQMGVRMGWWVVPELLKIRSFGVYKRVSGQHQRLLRSYEALIIPTEALEIKIGVMATPTTELRPNPLTWQSQVETNAESTIPGGQPGIKIRYLLLKDLGLTYGIHDHEGKIINHLKLTHKRLSLAGFLGGKQFFLATKWRYKNGNLVMTRTKKETAVSAILPIAPQYKFYLDMAYSDATRKMDFGEWGLRKHFKDLGFLKGFISINYSSKLRLFQGGLFIHI